jgi:hypothetical protein
MLKGYRPSAKRTLTARRKNINIHAGAEFVPGVLVQKLKTGAFCLWFQV